MAEPVVVVAPMLDEHDGGQVGKKTDFGGKSPGKSPGELGNCMYLMPRHATFMYMYIHLYKPVYRVKTSYTYVMHFTACLPL